VPKPFSGGFENRPHDRRGNRSTVTTGNSEHIKLLRRVAGQCLTDPRVGSARVGHDNLQTPGLRTVLFHYDPRCAALKCLLHKLMAIAAGRRLGDGHIQLPRVKSAMIVAAAGDFPVHTSYKLSLRKHSP
jgi:hypothetical protein